MVLWSMEEHLERYDTSSATSNVVNAKLPGMKSKTLALPMPAAHRVGRGPSASLPVSDVIW